MAVGQDANGMWIRTPTPPIQFNILHLKPNEQFNIHRGCTKQHWHVDESDPVLAGEGFVSQPDYQRAYGTEEKEPVDIWVDAQVAKDSPGAN